MLLHRELPGGAPGFIVQKQAGRVRELLIRVGEDAVFGPTLGFGQGGTAAEALADVALDLPPLNLPLADALIARTRVAGSLGALRDQPAADLAAIADAIVRVSQLVVDFPEIAALEINPLFADAAGVSAADAWITLRPPGAPPARLAIAPYPAELAAPYQGRTEAFLVRPIRPEDAEAHAALFARLSPEDVRFRFFSAIRALSPEQIARLTQVDYDREIAFVAVREATAETVAVARLVRENDDAAEFAVLVQADVRGQGLGEPSDAAADRLGARPRCGLHHRRDPGRQRADARPRATPGLHPTSRARRCDGDGGAAHALKIALAPDVAPAPATIAERQEADISYPQTAGSPGRRRHVASIVGAVGSVQGAVPDRPPPHGAAASGWGPTWTSRTTGCTACSASLCMARLRGRRRPQRAPHGHRRLRRSAEAG